VAIAVGEAGEAKDLIKNFKAEEETA